MGENRLERKRRGNQRKQEVKIVRRVEKKTRQKVRKDAKIVRRSAKQKMKRHN